MSLCELRKSSTSWAWTMFTTHGCDTWSYIGHPEVHYAAFRLTCCAPHRWRFLFNCASATGCRGKTKQWLWAASSRSIDYLAALPTVADRRQLTSIQLESNVARWNGQSSHQSAVTAESCNTEMTSSDQAMKRQCGEQQASLKPVLLFYYWGVVLRLNGKQLAAQPYKKQTNKQKKKTLAL